MAAVARPAPRVLTMENLEFLATGARSARRPGRARTPRAGSPPLARSDQPPPFSSLPVRNKSRLPRSWCCCDSPVRCYQCLGSSIGQSGRLPPAPGSRVPVTLPMVSAGGDGTRGRGGSGGRGCTGRSDEQFAEAESRFNIVTLTMYLIDISFFFVM